MSLDQMPERQLELGAAGFFRPEAEEPAGNQLRVLRGAGYRGAYSVEDQTAADQLTAGFPSVSAPGLKRYDLVYVDLSGAAQIAAGAEVAAAAPAFDGAPGANIGPPMPAGSPVAYVLIDETGVPVVETADIFQINGFIRLSRDFQGYLIDKGLFGSAPAGASDDVSALFASDTRVVASTGGGTVTEPDSGGSDSQAGVVTTPPLNYVTLSDQVGDEILHTSGARMYGRLTEAAGTWTLAYHYIDGAGAEQSMDPSSDTSGPAPTDLRLVGVPRVFSEQDPSRPLFQSSIQRLQDQVVGDIPTATTAVQGKGLKANNPTTQPAIPEIGSIAEIQNNGTEVAGGPWHTLNFPSGGIAAGGSPGVLDVNAAGAPGPPGGPGSPGPPGGPGGPGPPGPLGVAFSASATTGIGGNTLTTNIASGTVRFGYCSIATDLFTLGNFIGTAANAQQVMICSAGGGSCGRVGNVHESSLAASIYRCTTFAGTTAQITRVVGAQNFSQTAGIGAIGG